MAFLRINPPGQPIQYIDIGRGRARVGSGQGGVHGSMGGPLEPNPRSKAIKGHIPVPRATADSPRCGASFSGLICGRPLHDMFSAHRSLEACERDQLRRRARS